MSRRTYTRRVTVEEAMRLVDQVGFSTAVVRGLLNRNGGRLGRYEGTGADQWALSAEDAAAIRRDLDSVLVNLDRALAMLQDVRGDVKLF